MQLKIWNHGPFGLYAGLIALLMQILVACGGGGSTPPVPEVPAATPPSISSQPADIQATAGNAARFSVTADGTDLVYQWEKSSDNGASWTALGGETAAATTLAAVSLTDNGLKLRVRVQRNDKTTLSSAATLTVIAAVVAPAIAVQPASAEVIEGSAASFAATATGTSLNYQWQSSPASPENWQDISGATTAVLQLSSAPLSSDGTQYRLTATNAAGSATSGVATLTVKAATALPKFSAQPSAVSLVAPAAATFSASATGTPAPSYQWQRSTDGGLSFQNIATSATAAQYTTPATALADSGALYRVIASNSAGSATSLPAALTVTAALTAPAIQQQPADQSVNGGATLVISVVASGTPEPSYQWQISTDSGATFASINGATAPSYSAIADGTPPYQVLLRAVVSNSQGQVQTRSALVSVTASPALSANAGGPYFGTVGTALALNGMSAGKAVTKRMRYEWSILSAPAGSTAAFQYTPSSRDPTDLGPPTLVPDLPGDYRLKMVATSTDGVSAEATTVAKIETTLSCGVSGPVGTLELAQQKSCTVCHKATTTGIGPSFMSVAAKYRDVCGAKARLSSTIRRGQKSAEGKLMMPENIQLTDTEVEQLANWILGQQ